MPEALILEFSGVTEADYAKVNAHLGIDMRTGEGNWPPGLLSTGEGHPSSGALPARKGQRGLLSGEIPGAVSPAGPGRR